MTNREKYAEQILDIVCCGHKFSVSKNGIQKCYNTDCIDCFFYGGINLCSNSKREAWCESEYISSPDIPIDTPIDTPILVWDGDNQKVKRHFAGFEDGKIKAWRAGFTSWTSTDGGKVPWEHAELANLEVGELN